MKKILKYVLIALVALVALGIVFGGGDSEDTKTVSESGNKVVENSEKEDVKEENKKEEIEYIVVTKDELDEILDDNAAKAKSEFKGKYIEVTGRLSNIDSDLKYISLGALYDEYDFNWMHCEIKNQEIKDKVLNLSKDQEITIRGKVTDVGEALGYFVDIIEILD